MVCLCIDSPIHEFMVTPVHGSLIIDFNFVDDITMRGPALSVNAVFIVLLSALLKVGPTVNLAKCKLLPHTLSQLVPDKLCVVINGVVVLGTPIDTDEQCFHFTRVPDDATDVHVDNDVRVNSIRL